MSAGGLHVASAWLPPLVSWGHRIGPVPGNAKPGHRSLADWEGGTALAGVRCGECRKWGRVRLHFHSATPSWEPSRDTTAVSAIAIAARRATERPSDRTSERANQPGVLLYFHAIKKRPLNQLNFDSLPDPSRRAVGTGVNRFTPGPLVTPGPRGGSPGVRGRRRGLAGTYPRCWGSAGAAVAGPEPTTGSRLLRVWRC
eukprot:COSAG01_NODE_9033_length_2575_cov_55.692246_2_plen_199_part_00